MSNLRLIVIGLIIITAGIGIYRSATAKPLCEDVARYAQFLAKIDPAHRFGAATQLYDAKPEDIAAIFEAEHWLTMLEIPKRADYDGAFFRCSV